LIYLNFNSPLFIDYFLVQIHDELGGLPDNESKIERLALHQKKVGQMQLKSGFSLHNEFPAVRETLPEVLDRGIGYLITPKTKVLANPPNSVIEFLEKSDFRNYVTVPFKVQEVYLLNKTFIDDGGAPTETYKRLLEKLGPRLAYKNHEVSAGKLKKASAKVDGSKREC
jgi:hypothetical protein